MGQGSKDRNVDNKGDVVLKVIFTVRTWNPMNSLNSSKAVVFCLVSDTWVSFGQPIRNLFIGALI